MIRSANSKARRTRTPSVLRIALYVLGVVGFLFFLALVYETIVASHGADPESADGASLQSSLDNLNEEVQALSTRVGVLEGEGRAQSQQLSSQAQTLRTQAEALQAVNTPKQAQLPFTPTSVPAVPAVPVAPVAPVTKAVQAVGAVSNAPFQDGAGFSEASYFFLSEDNVPARIKAGREESRASCVSSSVERCGCQLVAFIGGMKCGSTNLATRLKHKADDPNTWDPNSGFVDAGKEPCWALRGNGDPWSHFRSCPSTCPAAGARKMAALDGCPYYHDVTSARGLWCKMPATKLILLVRDPVERMISQFNEKVARQNWRGQQGGSGIDSWISESLSRGNPLAEEHVFLSDYGGALENFLRFYDASQFMVIRTEKMKGSNEHVQQFMDGVFEFIGVASRPVVTEMSYVRKTDPNYKVPTDKVIQQAVAFFRPLNEKLFSIVGARWRLHYFDN
jgi:hypothetical protein